jgi:hypothetical protein
LVGVALSGDHQIIAAVFALGANDGGHPPDRGVIKHQALDEYLQ